MAIATERLERGFASKPIDTVIADVAHARAALLRADEQLTKPEPDLHLVEAELQLATRAMRTAARIVDTEIVRAER